MTPKIILSKTAQPELTTYLGSLGYQVEPFGPIENVQEPLRCHPDMLHCRLNRDTVFTGDSARLSPAYPGDIIYNACSTGKFFIHNLKYTAPELLGKVENGLARLGSTVIAHGLPQKAGTHNRTHWHSPLATVVALHWRGRRRHVPRGISKLSAKKGRSAMPRPPW